MDPCNGKVIRTKKETTTMVHIADAALVLVFCTMYSSRYGDHSWGLVAWAMSFTSLTWYVAMRNPPLPGYRMKTKNVVLILGSWSYSLLFLGLLLHDYLPLLTGIILIFLLIMLVSLYWRRLSRESLNLKLVVRGETAYLEEIEAYIRKNCASSDCMELVELSYTEGPSFIGGGPECRSPTEFKEERQPTHLREKERDREQATFSCLLRGELRYLEAIKAHIADYLSDGKIQRLDFLYSI